MRGWEAITENDFDSDNAAFSYKYDYFLKSDFSKNRNT
ncbi:hypothetical protein CSC02_1464 [Enterobacter hormaechei subsp. hoffmannii]|nr:hypothetical protein CSC02_1464 [Enterobacter hormaechei subsp. hoffmannii]